MKTWGLALSFGWKLHQALKNQAWGTSKHAETDHQFTRNADFVVIELGEVVVLVDLTTSEIVKIYTWTHKTKPDKAWSDLIDIAYSREIENQTWIVHTSTPSMPPAGFVWAGGASVSVGD